MAIANGLHSMNEPDTNDAPPRVLVVDDEPPVITIVTRMLARLGCELFTAASGPDALEVYRTLDRPIDLLLTDLQMPKMSGRVLAAMLRSMQPDLKVLYMTGRSDELFGPAKELGPLESFIEKPLSPAQICEAVSLHLYGTLVPPHAPKPRTTGQSVAA